MPRRIPSGRRTDSKIFFLGYKGNDPKFITTQGMKHWEEVEPFWLMILENNVQTIVMLTRMKEEGKNKCLQYWPDVGKKIFGRVKVSFVDRKKWPTFEIKTFQVEDDSGKSREVKHLFYEDWPDHGVPNNVGSVLDFHKRMRGLIRGQSIKAPTIVHCSAGVGRTGTILAMDYLIEEAEDTEKVNPWQCLKFLRQQRDKMIQTEVSQL